MTWRRTETQLVAALKLAGIDVHQVDGNQYMSVISLGGCERPDECVAKGNVSLDAPNARGSVRGVP